LVLIVLRSGGRVQRHRTDHRLSLQALSGHLRLNLPDRTVELPAGHVLVLDEMLPHDLVADEDSVALLSLSGVAAASRPGCKDDLDVLVAEHQRFAKLLALVEDELDRVHGGEDPDYELLREVFFYMRTYPDRLHHPKEDLLFARVAERAPAARDLVEELRGDHRQIAESGARFLANLEAALLGNILPRQAVEEPAREYVALYRKHMALEERLLPLARGHLTREDCARVQAVVGTDTDPIFGAVGACGSPGGCA
jgi:hemerythrin-like domain-containing protein